MRVVNMCSSCSKRKPRGKEWDNEIIIEPGHTIEKLIFCSKKCKDKFIKKYVKEEKWSDTSEKKYEYVLKYVNPQVTIQAESKEEFKKLMSWDEETFMSYVFVRLIGKEGSALQGRIDLVYKSLLQIEKLNGSFILKEAIKLYAKRDL